MMGSKRSQLASGQHFSPTIYPEKRGKIKSSRPNEVKAVTEDPEKAKGSEHRIDIGDERSDLLGYDVFSGKLALIKKSKSTGVNDKTGSSSANHDGVDAKLSSKALVWGAQMIHLEDVISVSYSAGLRHFTMHSYPLRKQSCMVKARRSQKDFRFLASSPEEAIQWVSGFAELQYYVKCLPHPMASSKKEASDLVASIPWYDQQHMKCKSPPKVFIILNPRSGHGRSSKLFHEKVEPIFELAGFKMEVVKTQFAGHARKLALSIDFATCPDGIICVGGDGIVNEHAKEFSRSEKDYFRYLGSIIACDGGIEEDVRHRIQTGWLKWRNASEVLNGLLSRDNQKEAVSIPIGIIPAGSDNSLVWTILGVRDPISAAITIVKGGLTAMDVFAVEWIQTGTVHYGTTVSYFGFLSDVLELSEKYQKRFGPLRYFVAGFLKFLCLPKYSFELEYLPISKDSADGKVKEDHDKLDMSDLYTDIMRRSSRESLPRASSLSSIDSIMTPSRMSGGDLDTTGSTLASSEPSDYVRGLDPKSKRLSMGRSNLVEEPEEVIHPPLNLSTTPNWPRTRSKSRTDKGWASVNTTNESRSSWAAIGMNDREDISSTISDPGPIWDAEPHWDNARHWEGENPINLPGPPDDIEQGIAKELVPNLDEKWVVKKGQFIGVLVCNHSCRTVQSLSSQVVAPKAVHDDNTLDLLLVHGSGRLRLLRFLVRLQLGRHLLLPYVEYVKVKSVKLKASRNGQNGCGIDGELLKMNGQVMCSLLPEQCSLVGRPAIHRV